MLKVLVVADDMTGNNDTGALMSQAGLSAVASLDTKIDPEYLEGKEVLCLNADSRGADPEIAYQKVYEAVKEYWYPGMLCCKRIDTTLRGNLGSEIDGMLDALPDGYRAIVVSAYPRAGRICVGGHVLVNGEALTKSGAENDPVTPIRFDRVADNIKQQSRRPLELIDLQEVRMGHERICELINRSKAEIFVFDAIAENDLEIIAHACVDGNIQAACVDPGGFSVKLAQKRYHQIPREKNLLVIGSLSEVTRKQVEKLSAAGNTLIYSVSIHQLMEDYEMVRKEMTDYFGKGKEDFESFCILTEEKVCDRMESTERNAEEISKSFARLGIDALFFLKNQVVCVYLSGGDTAQGFLRKLGVRAMDVKEEVMPLAVYARPMDPEWNYLQVLTKGGMIGGKDALIQMLAYAKKVR